jgi:hypothetical protein
MNWKILLACVVAVFAGTGDFIEHSVWANGTARAPFVYAKFDSVASRLADTLIHDSLNARLPVNIPIAGTNASGVIIPSRYLLVDTAHMSLIQGPSTSNASTAAYSFIEGRYNLATSPNDHIEGYNNADSASGGFSHMEGKNNYAIGYIDHVEGDNNQVRASTSHTEGYSNNVVQATVAHVEGQTNTLNSSFVTHVEGESNVVGASYSHVEGYYNVVTPAATYSHTEGPYNYTKGTACHTEGQSDSCKGNLSTVHGYGNVSHYQQAVFGRFAANDNISDSLPTVGQKILKVGWGVNGGALKDVFAVSDSGFVTQGVKSAVTLASDANGRIVASTALHDSLTARITTNIGIAGTDTSGNVVSSAVLHGDPVSYSVTQATNKDSSSLGAVFGHFNIVTGYGSAAFGDSNKNKSPYSFVIGSGNVDSGGFGNNYTEGFQNRNASAVYSHLEGQLNTMTAGAGDHIEGVYNSDSACYAMHIGGGYNKAYNSQFSILSGYYDTSRAGSSQLVSGSNNYAACSGCIVSGSGNHVGMGAPYSLTLGIGNTSNGAASLMTGEGNIAGYNQTILGRFSKGDILTGDTALPGQKVFKIGWGTDAAHRKDVFSVSDSGYISSASFRGAGSRYLVVDSSGKLSTTTGTGDTVDGSYTAIIIDSAHGVALSDSIEKTVITMTLAAGDWDVSAVATVSGAMSPYVNSLGASISTTNNAMATNGTEVYSIVGGGSLIPGKYGRVSASIPPIKFRSTSPQTVYLVVYAVWVGGTGVTAYGRISARRWN